MPDARIKDCVCRECAERMGYEPSKSVVGVWMGDCEFCGECKPLTSLSHDWRKKGSNNGK